MKIKISLTIAIIALAIAACAPSAPAAPPATAVPAATLAPQATSAPVTTPAAPKSSEVKVDIKLFQYQPNPVEVKVGTTVTWTNQDNIVHSVTNGTPPTPGKAFDSGLFDQGKAFSFTFAQAGEFPYFCTRHNSLQGVVKVTP